MNDLLKDRSYTWAGGQPSNFWVVPAYLFFPAPTSEMPAPFY